MLSSRTPSRLRAVAWRRGWVLVLTVLVVVGAAAYYSHRKAPSYTASAYVLVSSGANNKGPGSANEASSLATTYAGLISKDSNIIAAVSSELGQSQATVRKSIAVFTSNSTAVLEVRYSAPTARLAVDGSTDLARAISGPAPVTPTIPPNSVLLASLPTVATATATAKTISVPLGIIVGLLLGLVIAVAWERLDSRVDDADDLESVAGVPVSSYWALSPRAASALVQRWIRDAPPGPLRVGLVSSERGMRDVVRGLEERLDVVARRMKLAPRPEPAANGSGEAAVAANGTGTATPGAGGPASRGRRDRRARLASNGRHPGGDHAVQFATFGRPGTDEVGQVAALESDLVVLAVPRGGRTRDIKSAVATLEEFGRAPGWAVLVPRPARLQRWRAMAEARRRRALTAPPREVEPVAGGEAPRPAAPVEG